MLPVCKTVSGFVEHLVADVRGLRSRTVLPTVRAGHISHPRRILSVYQAPLAAVSTPSSRTQVGEAPGSAKQLCPAARATSRPAAAQRAPVSLVLATQLAPSILGGGGAYPPPGAATATPWATRRFRQRGA